MEDQTLGACTYTGVAGKGSVACANGAMIKCYDLVAGDPAQPARRSFLVEADRLLMVCSNSIKKCTQVGQLQCKISKGSANLRIPKPGRSSQHYFNFSKQVKRGTKEARVNVP